MQILQHLVAQYGALQVMVAFIITLFIGSLIVAR